MLVQIYFILGCAHPKFDIQLEVRKIIGNYVDFKSFQKFNILFLKYKKKKKMNGIVFINKTLIIVYLIDIKPVHYSATTFLDRY